MVDSIVDNQTLRTQRKAEIRLQLDPSTSADAIRQLVEECKKILGQPHIESPAVFLNDISGTAFQLNIDYFTPPIEAGEFNEIKQQVNLEILKLLENLKIAVSGTSVSVKLMR
jgi:MscS family membrane protein